MLLIMNTLHPQEGIWLKKVIILKASLSMWRPWMCDPVVGNTRTVLTPHHRQCVKEIAQAEALITTPPLSISSTPKPSFRPREARTTLPMFLWSPNIREIQPNRNLTALFKVQRIQIHTCLSELTTPKDSHPWPIKTHMKKWWTKLRKSVKTSACSN